MASNFHIQKPYVLATLPRPLDHSEGLGHYVCGEVFGQQGSKRKRKRSEISVGIDGDAVNIYDVPSTRLITSYPIPPQSSITCPPCSTRWRSSMAKDISRYTYVSTRKPQQLGNDVTVFKDVLGSSGTNTSTSTSTSLWNQERIIHLDTISLANSNQRLLNEGGPNLDVIAVASDGSVWCLRGETLERKWQTTPSVFLRSFPAASDGAVQVEHAQIALAADVVDGIFGGVADAFDVFPQKVQRDAFNPDVLLLVTRSFDSTRHFHVVALSPLNDATALSRPNLLQVHAVPLSDGKADAVRSRWQLDVRSGCLQEQFDSTILTYDLTESIAKLKHTLQTPGMESFLRLSSSSVLTSAGGTLSVYNQIYRSVQATSKLEIPARLQETSPDIENEHPCIFITYLARLNIALCLKGSFVVAVQLEAPKSRNKKRRAEGLLIDSIGRGFPEPAVQQLEPILPQGSSIFANYLRGSLSQTYWNKWTADMRTADDFLAKQDILGFEHAMAKMLRMKLEKEQHSDNTRPRQNGDTASTERGERAFPVWRWPDSRDKFPEVDRRYVLYAISRVFSWKERTDVNQDVPRLACQMPDGNVLNYLVGTGSLTTDNLRSSFRDQLREVDDAEARLAEQVPMQLVEADPTMGLLLLYISATKLGPTELVTAIRLFMRSLELVHDPEKSVRKLLTYSKEAREHNDDQEHGGNPEAEENGVIGMELDRVEQELEMTEFYLDDYDSEVGVRSYGLSAAFSKLGTCSAPATVRALRRMYKPQETLALIHLLRMELIKDGWTTRYQDTPQPRPDEVEPRGDEDDDRAPPDGSIGVLADLLCRCLDSVGPAGWLINDVVLARESGGHADSTDFLGSLKLEVSAALEGIQEAVYLRGILREMVRYGIALQKVPGGGAGSDNGEKTNRKHHPNKQQQQQQQQQGSLVLVSSGSAAGSASTPGKKKTVSSWPAHQGGATNSESPAGGMLPLGLKVTQRVSPEKIISGGEVVQRSKRERGYLTSQNVGAYSLDRIDI